VNGGTRVPICGCVIGAIVVEAVRGEVTPISIETGIAMAVETLAPIVGANACVDFAYEEDCDDCDHAEVPRLVGRTISFKALPLLKFMHIQISFEKKVYQK